MELNILEIAGLDSALKGIALNKLQPIEKMPAVADKLAKARDGSHKKFLRHVQVWLKIKAPMYWWYEFDTYKIGVTRNSSSIMHKPLEHLEFDEWTAITTIRAYKDILREFERGIVPIDTVKANTPAGVLYTSVVNLNYQVLQTIYKDRCNHRLDEWQIFCKELEGLPNAHWLTGNETL